MELFGILVIGFFIGIRHAMEADHLAAVASLSQNGGGVRFMIRRGMAWGIGHGIALLIICGLLIAAGDSLSQIFEAWLELLVAIMIVALGINTLLKMLKQKIHFHIHQHDGHAHLHAHSHSADRTTRLSHEKMPHEHKHAKQGHWIALLIGLLHGAAGSGALLVLVVAATHSIFEALIYVFIFASGAVVGMALLSVVISMPISMAQLQAGRINKIALASIASFCFWTGGQLGLESLTLLGFVGG